MTELSPFAQMVLAAFNHEARPEPHHQREAIAAALRAVADLPSASAPVPFRYRLLELADELEGAS